MNSEVKWLLAAALIPTLLVGGYFASSSLSGASASTSGAGDSYILQTTVRQVVTVREHGKVVVKRVPVVVRKSIVSVRPTTHTSIQTVEETRTVVLPGTVRTVEKKVIKYVPKYIPVTTKVQLVQGETTTVTQTIVQTVTQPVTVTVTAPSSTP